MTIVAGVAPFTPKVQTLFLGYSIFSARVYVENIISTDKQVVKGMDPERRRSGIRRDAIALVCTIRVRLGTSAVHFVPLLTRMKIFPHTLVARGERSACLQYLSCLFVCYIPSAWTFALTFATRC